MKRGITDKKKGGRINEEGEESDEDGLSKDIENDFNSVEQTGKPIGTNSAKIINNVIAIRTQINKKKFLKPWKITRDLKI